MQRIGALFATAPAEVLRWIEDSVESAAFDPGAIIIEQGATDRDCFIVTSGDVDVLIDGQVVSSAGPSKPQGELSLINGGPRRATVRAVTPVSAWRLPAEAFDRLRSDDPRAAAAVESALIDAVAGNFGWTPAMPRQPFAF